MIDLPLMDKQGWEYRKRIPRSPCSTLSQYCRCLLLERLLAISGESNWREVYHVFYPLTSSGSLFARSFTMLKSTSSHGQLGVPYLRKKRNDLSTTQSRCESLLYVNMSGFTPIFAWRRSKRCSALVKSDCLICPPERALIRPSSSFRCRPDSRSVSVASVTTCNRYLYTSRPSFSLRRP